MKSITLISFCSLILMLAPLLANAEVPRFINYQGMLNSNDGSSVDGPHEILFSIYSDTLNPDPLWSEMHSDVPVSNHTFHVFLGSESSFGDLFEANGELWLEITIDDEQPMQPMTRLSSVPWAMRAAVADIALSGGDGGGDGHSLDAPDGDPVDAVYVDGGGRVGIGTTDPRELLQIGDQVVVHDGGVKALGFNWTFESGPGDIRIVDGNAARLAFSPSRFAMEVAEVGGSGSPISWKSAVHVNTWTGDVGICTNTPSAKLDVAGAIACDVLKIRGGADLAEPFDITTSAKIQQGMVLSIDPGAPGKLTLATRAYDHCVAGIASGAGGVNPGLILAQRGSVADGELPVALTGRVFCLVDANHGAVRPGDLLTTSYTPGHAMRVDDPIRAQGAILGKAMGNLESGRDLVLVLVTLQ